MAYANEVTSTADSNVMTPGFHCMTPKSILVKLSSARSNAQERTCALLRGRTFRLVMVPLPHMDRDAPAPSSLLFDHHPRRLQERIGDQADDGGYRDQERVAHLPAEQDRKRDHADQDRQPVADGDFPEQDACAQDGADCRAIGALDKSLDVRILPMPREQRC